MEMIMTETGGKKRAMRSFQPDPDVDAMLEEAVSSGVVLKELMNEAMRKHGPSVLREQVKRLREQADRIEKKIGAKSR